MDNETVHCNCDCPHWGEAHDEIYIVRCDCGNEERVCGYCLQSGRVSACLDCSHKSDA